MSGYVFYVLLFSTVILFAVLIWYLLIETEDDGDDDE